MSESAVISLLSDPDFVSLPPEAKLEIGLRLPKKLGRPLSLGELSKLEEAGTPMELLGGNVIEKGAQLGTEDPFLLYPLYGLGGAVGQAGRAGGAVIGAIPGLSELYKEGFSESGALETALGAGLGAVGGTLEGTRPHMSSMLGAKVLPESLQTRKMRIEALAKQVLEKEAERPGLFNLPKRTLPIVPGAASKTPSDIVLERLVSNQKALPAPVVRTKTIEPVKESVRLGAILRRPKEALEEGEFAGRNIKEIEVGGTRPNIVGGSAGPAKKGVFTTPEGKKVQVKTYPEASQEFINAKYGLEQQKKEADRIRKEVEDKLKTARGPYIGKKIKKEIKKVEKKVRLEGERKNLAESIAIDLEKIE